MQEDVTLPSLPNIDALPNEEKLLIRSKYKLELFWVGSCYHLEQEAFPKLEGRKEKRLKLAELSKTELRSYLHFWFLIYSAFLCLKERRYYPCMPNACLCSCFSP